MVFGESTRISAAPKLLAFRIVIIKLSFCHSLIDMHAMSTCGICGNARESRTTKSKNSITKICYNTLEEEDRFHTYFAGITESSGLMKLHQSRKESNQSEEAGHHGVPESLCVSTSYIKCSSLIDRMKCHVRINAVMQA